MAYLSLLLQQITMAFGELHYLRNQQQQPQARSHLAAVTGQYHQILLMYSLVMFTFAPV
jgi:hypothetical protein